MDIVIRDDDLNVLGVTELRVTWELIEPLQFVNRETVRVFITKSGLPTNFVLRANRVPVKTGILISMSVPATGMILIPPGSLCIDVEADETGERPPS